MSKSPLGAMMCQMRTPPAIERTLDLSLLAAGRRLHSDENLHNALEKALSQLARPGTFCFLGGY